MRADHYIFFTFHLNIRSLSSNYDNFIHYLSQLKHEFSVTALSETWLTENSKKMFKLLNYNSVYYVKLKRPGGGVFLFFHYDYYGFKIQHDLCLNSTINVESEFIALMWVAGARNRIVGVIYCPPDQIIRDFNESLLCCLERIDKKDKKCYILGNFNINAFKHNTNTLIGDILNILHSSYFFPLIHNFTRVKDNSATLIDNKFFE